MTGRAHHQDLLTKHDAYRRAASEHILNGAATGALRGATNRMLSADNQGLRFDGSGSLVITKRLKKEVLDSRVVRGEIEQSA